MGRPRLCECGECPRCRARIAAKARYDALSPKERKALYERRDVEKSRATDRRRYRRHKAARSAATREYHRKNPEKVAGYKRDWAERNPEKRAAQVKAGNALRDGRLTKGPCARASEGGCSSRIEMHHEDYDRPLDVTWLCSTHHAATRRVSDDDRP